MQVCASDGAQWGVCEGCDAPAPDVAEEDTKESPDVEPPSGDQPPPDSGGGTEGVVPDVAPSTNCGALCGYGSLKGLVCAPNEQVFVSNATVTITSEDCDGQPAVYQTTTDAQGFYTMDPVVCGQHTVVVQAGSFSNSYQVAIDPGQQTDITGVGKKQCFKAQGVKIGVFWGQWDHQHDLLDDLGFEYDYFNFEWDYFNDVNPDDIEAVQLLRDLDALKKYQILFFNCGSAGLKYVNSYPEISDNLRQFVLEGGSLYASDLAWAYIEGAFDEAIDFYSDTDLPQTAMSGPQVAVGHQTVPATIVDPDLIAYVGTSTFPAEYGPGPLIVVQDAGPGGTVHVKGLVELDDATAFVPGTKHVGPVVVSNRPGQNSGRVVYTTFHNDEQADELMLKILHYLVFQL